MRKAVTILLVFAILSGASINMAAAEEPAAAAGVITQSLSGVVWKKLPAQVVPTPPPRKQHAPTLKPILIGAGIGAGLLGWAALRLCDGGSCGKDTAKAMLWGGGLGAALGYVAATR